MNVYLSKFMMYYEIYRMHREGHSDLQISKYLIIDRRTVKKYLSMNEQEYENFLTNQASRKMILQPYEGFVRERLKTFQDTSAAQMHDWLKEKYSDFPDVNQKTVFNFVHWVRDKHNLPRTKPERQYQLVEELSYGKQAQVDFGEYNMRTSTGSRVKVFFFTMVLSRSRYKYVWFTDRYFTSELAIQAHEQAFEYIQGVPDEVVYDQDKVFIVSENGGDIILTDAFRAYTREQSFALEFCRKADPESKGKIENVVKYVKQNFLYNRTFHDIETLNGECLGWMGRTANALLHAFTQKVPYSEWVIEQPFLTSYTASLQKPAPLLTYTVRKDNAISYKGNHYSVPLGTYKGRGSLVSISASHEHLRIFDEKGETELCKHQIDSGRGRKILNSDHKRDKSAAIDEMMNQLCSLLQHPEQAKEWLSAIKTDKPRYIRDQLLILRETIESADPVLVEKTLQYCITNNITSAADFKSIIIHYQQEEQQSEEPGGKVVHLNPLKGATSAGTIKEPDKSSIDDYQSLLKKK
ncbi:MAG: IS21 family transposase [Cytophagaceae bacterium]